MKMKISDNKVIKIYSDFDFEEGLVKIEKVIWKNPKDQIRYPKLEVTTRI